MNMLNSLMGGGIVAAALLFAQFLIQRHDTRHDDIKCIKRKLEQIEGTQKEQRAETARSHILRFADELYNDIHHSKEYFDQILDDIDDYEEYCEAHPEFKNSKTLHAVKTIRETHERLYAEHKL